MSAILDASFVVAFLTEERGSDEVDAYMIKAATSDFYAPSLLNWEVGNVLRTKAKRGLIRADSIPARLEAYRRIRLSWNDEDDLTLLMALALRLDLTVYDAAYLALAKRLTLPLATFDQDLRRAALAEQVPLAF